MASKSKKEAKKTTEGKETEKPEVKTETTKTQNLKETTQSKTTKEDGEKAEKKEVKPKKKDKKLNLLTVFVRIGLVCFLGGFVALAFIQPTIKNQQNSGSFESRK